MGLREGDPAELAATMCREVDEVPECTVCLSHMTLHYIFDKEPESRSCDAIEHIAIMPLVAVSVYGIETVLAKLCSEHTAVLAKLLEATRAEPAEPETATGSN